MPLNMNCRECSHSKGAICSDVLSLFNKLHIPPQEQIVLWEIIITTDCRNIKNILPSLQNKNKIK
jgi:hypothetical protein